MKGESGVNPKRAAAVEILAKQILTQRAVFCGIFAERPRRATDARKAWDLPLFSEYLLKGIRNPAKVVFV